jgi:acetylornithine deacetylase/succinyl-diaminopimelate desuccinylase-like protein
MMINILDRTLDMAVQIQQIPAPTFDEMERADFIRGRFAEENLSDIEVDILGNVFARLPGDGNSRPVVVSAHSDTVFPHGTDLRIQRESDKIFGPGIGDNSLGVAGLFSLLWTLRQREVNLPGDLWLVANVCEEGLGDLNGMRAVVDRFGKQPLAYLILEGMAYGEIFHRGLGVQRYRITAATEGGHSWADYGIPSAIHDLAALVTKLVALEIPKQPRTSLNVGIISGGTSINTIAAQAYLELDLRSENPETLQKLVKQVEDLVASADRPSVKFEAEIIGHRPAGTIPENHPLVKLVVDILAEAGTRPHLNIGSTDANIPLSKGLPAVCIGLAKGRGAHTTQEYIYTELLPRGIEQLFEVVTKTYQILK